MISNTTTLCAVVSMYDRWWTLIIVAWDDGGRAMVADPRVRLVAATELNKFVTLDDYGPDPEPGEVGGVTLRFTISQEYSK